MAVNAVRSELRINIRKLFLVENNFIVRLLLKTKFVIKQWTPHCSLFLLMKLMLHRFEEFVKLLSNK